MFYLVLYPLTMKRLAFYLQGRMCSNIAEVPRSNRFLDSCNLSHDGIVLFRILLLYSSICNLHILSWTLENLTKMLLPWWLNSFCYMFDVTFSSEYRRSTHDGVIIFRILFWDDYAIIHLFLNSWGLQCGSTCFWFSGFIGLLLSVSL